ncbi:MAG: hypothetical protein GEV13_04450 [Rhodospirillales bacterium]|nr:hypothetical protein [Rhodospirillales bacterium]
MKGHLEVDGKENRQPDHVDAHALSDRRNEWQDNERDLEKSRKSTSVKTARLTIMRNSVPRRRLLQADHTKDRTLIVSTRKIQEAAAGDYRRRNSRRFRRRPR